MTAELASAFGNDAGGITPSTPPVDRLVYEIRLKVLRPHAESRRRPGEKVTTEGFQGPFGFEADRAAQASELHKTYLRTHGPEPNTELLAP